jgi:tetratricopeptide (TPR) repeat protein
MLMNEQLRMIDDLLTRREIKKAEVLIARYMRLDLTPRHRTQMLILRARTRLLGGRVDDALDDLQKARALHPEAFDEPATLEVLGDAHFARFELASVGFADRHDTAQALEAYERILADHPQYDNTGWVLYQKGRVMLTENRVEDAVSCFQQTLLNPSFVPSLTAYCYERLGFVAFYEEREPKRALSFLIKAVDTYPSSEPRLWLAQVHTLRSRVLREMHDHTRALEAAETAITVASAAGAEGKPGYTDALLTAAEIAAELDGHEKDVIAYLQQFLQNSKKPLGIDVTWSRVHEMLADAQWKTGQATTSLASYQAALEFNPYHPWELSLYYRIARCHYQLREYEKAVETIERMLQTAADDGQTINDYRVYNVLGNAHFALKHYDQALHTYQQALEIAPPNAENLDKLKQYHRFAEELSRAV